MSLATYAQPTAHVWSTPTLQPHDVRAARVWTRERLAGRHLADQIIDDAVLIVSELLTNVLHNAPGEAEITVLAERDMLTITCADRDVAQIRSGTLDPGSAHSVRLASVEALTSGCFIRRRSDRGKRIIALLAVTDDRAADTERLVTPIE